MSTQRTTAPRRSRRLAGRYREHEADAPAPFNTSSESLPQALAFSISQEQSKTSSNVFRNRQKGRVARSPNAFMLFRSDFWAKEKQKDKPVERDHRDISRIAAICWNNLDEEAKGIYRRKADEQKELHCLQRRGQQNITKRKRRSTRRLRGCVEEERIKRLALQVIAEFRKVGEPRACTREGPAADYTHQTNSSLVRSEDSREESAAHSDTMEVMRECASTTPALPEIKLSDASSLMNNNQTVGQFTEEDNLTNNIGRKLKLSKPSLLNSGLERSLCWSNTYQKHGSQSPRDHIRVDGCLSDPASYDIQEARPTIVTWDMAYRGRSLPVEESGEVDYDAELEKYFHFDRYNEV